MQATGLGFGVWSLGFRVFGGSGFGVWGLKTPEINQAGYML